MEYISKENTHIEDFMRDYIDGLRPYNYAVLLKGKWGQGKTYFITDFLKK